MQNAHAWDVSQPLALLSNRKHARDHGLRGNDAGRGSEPQQREQRPLRRKQIEWIDDSLRRSQQQRALAKVVEQQTRPHQHKPSQRDGLATEVAEIRIQRLAARYGEKYSAEH